MIENLRYVDGEPVTNRARYWIYSHLQNQNKTMKECEIEGVSRKTIWSFVSNGRSMTIEKLALLADFLDVDFRSLFDPTPDEIRELNQR